MIALARGSTARAARSSSASTCTRLPGFKSLAGLCRGCLLIVPFYVTACPNAVFRGGGTPLYLHYNEVGYARWHLAANTFPRPAANINQMFPRNGLAGTNNVNW